MNEHVEYGLIVSFPDQSEAFTLGVEAGMFWQRLEAGERDFTSIAHTENLECLRRMAETRGLIVEALPSEVEGWADITVMDNRPRLRVIQGGLSISKERS